MKTRSIFGRYLIREMASPFLINVMFFMFIFLLTQILDITSMIVNYRVGISFVFLMILYSMPYFLVFVIPMSVMMAVLLTFLRLSGDNEIVALKSGGISIYQLLPPVLVFCLIGCLLTGIMNGYGLAWGKLSLGELMIEAAQSNFDIGLKERTFNDNFKDVMLYVNKVDLKNKELIDIFIEDQRRKDMVLTIVSPRGFLYSEPDKPVFHLKLFNGTMSQVDIGEKSVNSVQFKTYEVTLDLEKAIKNANKKNKKREKEMNLNELWEYLKTDTKKDTRYYLCLMEFHSKFSIPFACFSLGLLAVPLGIRVKSARRSSGMGLGIALFLFYYMMLSAGMVFGETGVYPPAIGMWVPNIVTGGIGVWLLIRCAKDRPIQITFLSYITGRLLKKLMRR
ncbi:LPS export ABC transporter permease LptF [Desulfococcaceae bacterium HSG8]|nr:LPS export ABC transporter permease LptF [Desulfococcaceae bacterium HSG8]